MFEVRPCDTTFSASDILALVTRCYTDAEGLSTPCIPQTRQRDKLSSDELSQIRAMQTVDPNTLVVAIHRETPVGLCAVKIPEKRTIAGLRLLGVLPDWRRQGIGRILEAHAVTLARRHRCTTIRTEAVLDGRNKAGICFFEQLGWTPSLEVAGLRMWRDLLNLPPIDLPVGYTIRTYQSGDDEAFVRIINGAFPDGWGYTNKQFQEGYLASPHFQPDRIFFSVYREECVGTATAWAGHHEGRETGQLHWVAVLPQHQRKGVAKALCVRTLHKLKEIGYRDVVLGTMEILQPAIRLYHRLGFTDLYHHHIIYEKPV